MKVEKSICITVENFILKTTAAFALCGELVPAGALIEVSRDEATNLKARNLAVDATQEGVDTADKIIASGTIDSAADLAQRVREVLRKDAPEINPRNLHANLTQAQIDSIIERSQSQM